MSVAPPGKLRILAWSAAFEAMLGVLALAAGPIFGYATAASFDATHAALTAGLVATVPMLVAVAVLMSLPVAALVRIRRLLDEIIGTMFRDFSLAELALVSLMAGLGEELLFRGLLQGSLGARFGTTGALVVASVVFGLAHSITPTYALIATGFGAYLGWLWIVTGNLAVPMVAHAAYDFVALAVLVRAARGRRHTRAPAHTIEDRR